MVKKKAINTSGKHKSAIARATVSPGKGIVRVNSQPVEIITPELAKYKIEEPLKLAGKRFKGVDIIVKVKGGGIIGQAMAVRTAIARGLVEFLEDDDLEKLYREYDRSLLVNDPRRKMPKRPLGRGARAKKQKSYR